MNTENMKIAKIRSMDISNGPGVRVSLFTQGCNHKCKNCFNQETWNINDGLIWNDEVNKKIINLMNHDHIKGLSILGGDPLIWYTDAIYSSYMSNSKDMLLDLLKTIKKTYPDKTIWLWTGYVWESICNANTEFSQRVMPLLDYIDIIIDGLFVEELKDNTLKYCGSSNQRVIDVKKTLNTGIVSCYK